MADSPLGVAPLAGVRVRDLTLLLADGIGDTIRVSLTAEPEEEIPVAYEILRSLELRSRGVTFVSCPSCGRVEIDIMAIANEVEKRLAKVQTPIQVAVMGCLVNGPGESSDADVGLSGGRGKGMIYRKGKHIRTVPEDQFLDAVLQEVASQLPEREARLIYPGGDTLGPVSPGRTRETGIAGKKGTEVTGSSAFSGASAARNSGGSGAASATSATAITEPAPTATVSGLPMGKAGGRRGKPLPILPSGE